MTDSKTEARRGKKKERKRKDRDASKAPKSKKKRKEKQEPLIQVAQEEHDNQLAQGVEREHSGLNDQTHYKEQEKSPSIVMVADREWRRQEERPPSVIRATPEQKYKLLKNLGSLAVATHTEQNKQEKKPVFVMVTHNERNRQRNKQPLFSWKTPPSTFLDRIGALLDTPSLLASCLVRKSWLSNLRPILWRSIPAKATKCPSFLAQFPYYNSNITYLSYQVPSCYLPRPQIGSGMDSLEQRCLIELQHLKSLELDFRGLDYRKKTKPLPRSLIIATKLLEHNTATLKSLTIKDLSGIISRHVLGLVSKLAVLNSLTLDGWGDRVSGDKIIPILEGCREMEAFSLLSCRMGLPDVEFWELEKFRKIQKENWATGKAPVFGTARRLILNHSEVNMVQVLRLCMCLPELRELSLVGVKRLEMSVNYDWDRIRVVNDEIREELEWDEDYDSRESDVDYFVEEEDSSEDSEDLWEDDSNHKPGKGLHGPTWRSSRFSSNQENGARFKTRPLLVGGNHEPSSSTCRTCNRVNLSQILSNPSFNFKESSPEPDICDNHGFNFVSFLYMFCPHLQSFDFSDCDELYEDSDDIFNICESRSSSRPTPELRELKMRNFLAMEDDSFEIAARNCSRTLTTLDFSCALEQRYFRSPPFRNNRSSGIDYCGNILLILESCALLECLRVEPYPIYVDSLMSRQGKPWACKRLKTLGIAFENSTINRGTGAPYDSFTVSVAQDIMIERLSGLVDLETLVLEGGLVIEPISQHGGHFPSWDNSSTSTYHYLKLSLDSGLQRLSGLRKLKSLDITLLGKQEWKAPEIEWIASNWPMLRRLDGIYNLNSIVHLAAGHARMLYDVHKQDGVNTPLKLVDEVEHCKKIFSMLMPRLVVGDGLEECFQEFGMRISIEDGQSRVQADPTRWRSVERYMPYPKWLSYLKY